MLKTLQGILKAIDGKKTYIVAVVTIVFAVTQAWVGAITWDAAYAMILGALGLGSLRNGVSEIDAKV